MVSVGMIVVLCLSIVLRSFVGMGFGFVCVSVVVLVLMILRVLF